MRFQVMWKKTHLPPEAYRPFFETDSMADAKAIELNLQNHFKAKVGITIVPHAVAIGELPRSEKKSTRIFDNRY